LTIPIAAILLHILGFLSAASKKEKKFKLEEEKEENYGVIPAMDKGCFRKRFDLRIGDATKEPRHSYIMNKHHLL